MTKSRRNTAKQRTIKERFIIHETVRVEVFPCSWAYEGEGYRRCGTFTAMLPPFRARVDRVERNSLFNGNWTNCIWSSWKQQNGSPVRHLRYGAVVSGLVSRQMFPTFLLLNFGRCNKFEEWYNKSKWKQNKSLMWYGGVQRTLVIFR